MSDMALAQTPSEVTDEALANAARAGDRDAFSRLVGRYRDIALAYAFACLHNREEAEDAAQEAFVRAFQALDRFRVTERWASWLMRILRNLCVDILRRRRGRAQEMLDTEWPEEAPTPEMYALSAERRRELQTAIAGLPEKYRIPLLMHYVSRRTYREIAVALDVPESTVVGRMAGALRQLRRRFGDEIGYPQPANTNQKSKIGGG
jgi:RNA polymerase sigma-70 factor, ECF subfamily